MSTATEQVVSFEHVNLNQVDPSSNTITPGDYNLMVADAGIKTFTYSKGKNAGSEGSRTEFKFVITDSESFSGKTIYQSLFAGNGTLKQLRRIADATGISQEGTFEEWLVALKDGRAKFNAPVQIVDGTDKEGNARKEPKVNLWEIAPSV